MSSLKKQALFWGCLFLLIVALILHIRQLFAMAAVLAVLPPIARWIGRRKLVGLAVAREAPIALRVGEKGEIALRVTNETRTRKVFFAVADRTSKALGGASDADLPVVSLGPEQETSLHYSIVPSRRGVFRLGPVRLTAPDAIGLRTYNRQIDLFNDVIVYPTVITLPYLWPAAEGSHRPLKPRRRLRGEGDEFYGVRDYLPGDDPRRINWKATARRNKLALVEYERQESLNGAILLDLGKRWHTGRDPSASLETAVVLAASLAHQALARGSSIGLIASGAQDYSVEPQADEGQELRLLDALARVRADGDHPLTEAAAEHLHFLPPRSTILVISPAPDAGAVAAYLGGLGHVVNWFLLDLPSFGGASARMDYAPLMMALATARCPVRQVRGDIPLVANWQARGQRAGA